MSHGLEEIWMHHFTMDLTEGESPLHASQYADAVLAASAEQVSLRAEASKMHFYKQKEWEAPARCSDDYYAGNNPAPADPTCAICGSKEGWYLCVRPNENESRAKAVDRLDRIAMEGHLCKEAPKHNGAWSSGAWSDMTCAICGNKERSETCMALGEFLRSTGQVVSESDSLE
jgi:hypothetical protein